MGMVEKMIISTTPEFTAGIIIGIIIGTMIGFIIGGLAFGVSKQKEKEPISEIYEKI